MNVPEPTESASHTPAQQPPANTRHARPAQRRGWRWLGPLAAVLLVVAIVAVFYLALTTEEAEPEHWDEQPTPVQLTEVRGMTLQETVRGIGTLQAGAMVNLRPEISGRVQSIAFEEGAFVSEGDLLIQIDDEKLRRQRASRQAALRAAQVNVENARRTFARLEQLRERGVVSVDEHDQAQADLNSAEAEVDRLEADLALVERQIEDAQVRAPFDGMISQRMVDRGAYVNEGDDLARIYQTDPLEIAFSIPERYMGRVQRGQPVAVTVTAYPARTFSGTIDFVSPSIDESTRGFLVKASIDNPDGDLMPGGFATAVVTIGERPNRPVVPEESLVATRQGYSLFVVEDGRAAMRHVDTGLRDDGMVEITSGVALGDRVVRTGHLRLGGGELVRDVADESTGDVAGEDNEQSNLAEADAQPMAQQHE